MNCLPAERPIRDTDSASYVPVCRRVRTLSRKKQWRRIPINGFKPQSNSAMRCSNSIEVPEAHQNRIPSSGKVLNKSGINGFSPSFQSVLVADSGKTATKPSRTTHVCETRLDVIIASPTAFQSTRSAARGTNEHRAHRLCQLPCFVRYIIPFGNAIGCKFLLCNCGDLYSGRRELVSSPVF